MRNDLERVGIPGEHEARERTWRVVRSAFAERQPVPQPSHWRRVAVVAVALGALFAATLSTPGRAVIDEIREAVGVERAQPALFSLPADGRLLVASDAGIWVVQEDGSKRLLGNYREATWSPFGRFVAATRQNELAALEPDGGVRWTLARPGVRSPRWAGSETDTTIAYVDRTGIRVVAGDGTGDRLLVPHVEGRLEWRPGSGFVLAYVDRRGRASALDVQAGSKVFPPRLSLSPRFPKVQKLEWSSDGSRFLFVTQSEVAVFEIETAAPLAVRRIGGIVDAAFEPGSHRVAVARSGEVVLFDADRPTAPLRRLFAGDGPFESLAWSPNGRWLLVGWPAADQWVFVRGDGRSIRAVSNVSEQFRSRTFPRVEGWCCAR